MPELDKISMSIYLESPNRFSLENGNHPAAPNCPFGNKFEWIGYDHSQHKYVRFTKSVFKLLIKQKNKE